MAEQPATAKAKPQTKTSGARGKNTSRRVAEAQRVMALRSLRLCVKSSFIMALRAIGPSAIHPSCRITFAEWILKPHRREGWKDGKPGKCGENWLACFLTNTPA